MFGGDVAAGLRPGGQRGDGGDKQHIAAAGNQRRQTGANAGEGAGEIAVQRLAPLAVAGLGGGAVAHPAGAADEDINPAGLVEDGRQQPLAPHLAVGGIAHQRRGAGLIGDSLQRRFAPSGNKHPFARGAHQPRAGSANSGSTAGNYHDSRHPHSPVMGFPITLKSASGPGYRPEER
ncbi:Uncharacterised protein [Klebsiella pneumoniae]|nr:Uncharacterised protein [Klebsiella pneumoniae]